VILEKMDHQVCLDLLVQLDQWENEALQVQVELEGSKECQVLLVSLDSLVKMEMLEFLVNLEWWENKENKDLVVSPEVEEQWEVLELLVLEENLVPLD
jgi:hypothetical protein